MCEKSLATLSSKLLSHYNISLSPQALNERFNDFAVEYMKLVFNKLMSQQNKLLDNNFHFKRILINDSTTFSLSEGFSSEFKGVGGSSKSTIKIQLQYDLLSGNFTCCDPMSGEINDATHINKELKSRLIITKLSEDNKRKRNLKYEKVLEHERRTATERSTAWIALNAYITNIPRKILISEQVHEMYSLRWKVEIMFKVWKSIFKISNAKNNKNIKIQRFNCFLYGRLISILFSSGIVFAAKEIIHNENLDNNEKEISDIKAFNQVNEFLPILRAKIFEDEISIFILLNKIMHAIRRFAMKSIRKGDKSIRNILSYIAI